MKREETLGADYFEALYAQNVDPWNFQTSAYEAAKYHTTLQALGERRYPRALEVGCSIGVLTEMLAPLCAQLVAIDLNERALEAARRRNHRNPHVRFDRYAFPNPSHQGPFDLILLSEVLYYFSTDDLMRTTEVVIDQTAPGGDVLLVHWLGETEYPLTGDQAAERFITQARPRLSIIQQWRHEAYRLDHLRRPG